jgi:Sulfotransferase family
LNLFNFSAQSNISLNRNPAHNFAINHSMMIYGSDALYSFIPKNACSTMRLSVAIANGCIDGIEDGHWIHGNNQTFVPSTAEALKAKFSFAILRCPFRRLASVYLDKFVSKEPEAWQFRNAINRNLNLDNLTFKDFVMSLDKPWKVNMDIHWKPQLSFLLFKDYSEYFSLEDFATCVTTLRERINFSVIDARSLTNHGTNEFELLYEDNFADTPAFDIAVMKREGRCPSHFSLYTEEVFSYVSQIYSEDLAFYSHVFGKENLLDSKI